MNTIAPAIKRRRVQLGLTQKEMAEKIHLSEKAWQNIENGATRLDIERLQQIAEVLEISLTDLINAQETLYINQQNIEKGAGYARDLSINESGQKELYERLLSEKDEQVRLLREEVAVLKAQVNGLVEKVVKG